MFRGGQLQDRRSFTGKPFVSSLLGASSYSLRKVDIRLPIPIRIQHYSHHRKAILQIKLKGMVIEVSYLPQPLQYIRIEIFSSQACLPRLVI